MYALRETEFLRLKRTRIGREDFESLKVIGRGAFGEVGRDFAKLTESSFSNNIPGVCIKCSLKSFLKFYDISYQLYR